jgi:hypothetical protein
MKMNKVIATSIAMLLAAPIIANAQSVGIKFNEMPVGTKVFYSDYEGDHWTETFTGRTGKFYVLKRVHAKNKYGSSKRYYNSAGHQVKTIFSSGGRITYGPHSCRRIIGSCVENYKGRRKHSGRYTWKTKMTGAKTYHSEFVRVGEKITRDYTLTKYNLFARQEWTGSGRKRWVQIDKIVSK